MKKFMAGILAVLFITGCATHPTIVTYYVGGYGVVNAGNYPVNAKEFDGFLADGIAVPITTTTNAVPVATVLHRGHTFSIVATDHSPEVLILEHGIIILRNGRGTCHIARMIHEYGFPLGL